MSDHCVHGFGYLGAAPSPKPGSSCERPVQLGCRCGLRVTVDCQSSRSATCEPCGLHYRDRVRRIARVSAGSVLLVTLTAPGVPGHKRNVGGRRVQVLRDGKRHTTWKGGTWEPCGCWQSLCAAPVALVEHERAARAALPRWGTAGGKPRASVLPAAAVRVPDRPDRAGGLGYWNATLGARWNRLVTDALRERASLAWAAGAYFKATEPQARGALHVHVLIRADAGMDLTDAMVDELACEAERYGFGHVADVQVIASERAAGYVAKYVAKASNDRPGVPWKRVRVRAAEQRGLSGVHLTDEQRDLVAGLLDDPAQLDEPERERLVSRVCTRPTYRTWSSSRDWPNSMRALREAQEHFAALMEVSARVRLTPDEGWGDAQVWQWLGDCAPFRPDLPWDPDTGEVLRPALVA